MQNSSAKPHEHILSVDVLVSYHMTDETVPVLNKADADRSRRNFQVTGCQAHMTAKVKYNSNSSYDETMSAVLVEIRSRTKRVLGLGADSIWTISTCADWDTWDQVTGRDSNAEDAASAKWKNGKCHF